MSFIKTKDDKVWQLEELDDTGHVHWSGLMSMYVDDILGTGDEDAVRGALQVLSEVWAMSSVEWNCIDKALKYCGFEVSEDARGNGLRVHQPMNEQEMLQRWNIEEGAEYLTTKSLRIKKLKKILTLATSKKRKL